MEKNQMIGLLSETDFYIDERGRVVIDNPELMKEIHGAAGMPILTTSSNGACVNAGCE